MKILSRKDSEVVERGSSEGLSVLRDQSLLMIMRNLRRERLRRKIKAGALAAAIGISPQRLSGYELEQRRPNPDVLARWERTLRSYE